jgi:hypothetical protein
VHEWRQYEWLSLAVCSLKSLLSHTFPRLQHTSMTRSR